MFVKLIASVDELPARRPRARLPSSSSATWGELGAASLRPTRRLHTRHETCEGARGVWGAKILTGHANRRDLQAEPSFGTPQGSSSSLTPTVEGSNPSRPASGLEAFEHLLGC